MSAIIQPMESNPETMNKYLQRLGVPASWHLVDVLSLESEGLAWVPRPVLAVVLLFPLSETYEKYRQEQEAELISKSSDTFQNVFHMKQCLSNVCGSIALIHSVANNTNHIDLSEGLLKSYIHDANGLDSAAKGAMLENRTDLVEAYNDVYHTEGQDADTVNNHFVTFVHKDGVLFELDGRKSAPIPHGPTSSETLLEDAAKVCRKFIEREPDNLSFSVLALVPANE